MTRLERPSRGLADGRMLVRRLRASLVAVVLALYLVSRLVTMVGAALATLVVPGTTMASVLTQWDGDWYVEVVNEGYPSSVAVVDGRLEQNTTGFFPGYPLVVRAANPILPGGPDQAAVLVALVLGATATAGVALLAQALSDRATAERAAALFCFFPGSIAFSLAYSEGLMLTAGAGCLLFLHRRQWLAAGIAAAVASAARPTGIVLAASCAWAAAMAIRSRREWRALVAPLLAPAGMVAFFTFLWARTGDAGFWRRTSEEAWRERRDFGANTLQGFWDFLVSPFDDADQFVLGLSLLFALAAVGCLVRARLPGYANVYVAGMLALPLLSAILGPRPRFVLAAFPLFIGLAAVARHRAFVPLLAASAGLLPLVLVYYTSTFVAGAAGTVAP